MKISSRLRVSLRGLGLALSLASITSCRTSPDLAYNLNQIPLDEAIRSIISTPENLEELAQRHQSGDLTEANKALVDFPDEIDGASKIHKLYTPGAEMLLIHLANYHFPTDMNKVERAKRSLLFPQTRENKILETLIARGIKRVYAEGFTLEGWQDWRNSDTDKTYSEWTLYTVRNGRDEMNALISKIPKELKQEQNPERLKELEAISKELKRLIREAEPFTYVLTNNPSVGKALEGKIELRPAETRRDNSEEDRSKPDEREDITLDIIWNQLDRNLIELVTYGKGHDFAGNHSFGSNYLRTGTNSLRDNLYEKRETLGPISMIVIEVPHSEAEIVKQEKEQK